MTLPTRRGKATLYRTKGGSSPGGKKQLGANHTHNYDGLVPRIDGEALCLLRHLLHGGNNFQPRCLRDAELREPESRKSGLCH